MQFTPFVPIDASGGTLDPLSFLRPSGQLKDRLFKQFTLLSRHPAYHGVLCWMFQYLADKDFSAAQKDFSRKFRDVELFFGLVNSHPDVAAENLAAIGQSVLNITKFETLHANAATSYAQVKGWGPLFARLNYGTLGHYAGPSRVWRLFDSKGQNLTTEGLRLAGCWGKRGAVAFVELLEAWLSGSALDNLIEDAKPYALGGPPSAAEQDCWHTIIGAYIACYPDHQPLWNEPPSEEVLRLGFRQETYHSFFPALLKHYEHHQDLCTRIDLCGLFDTVAGLATLVFEWEYVRRTFDSKKVPDYQDVETLIVQALPPLLAALQLHAASQGFAWDLADELHHASTWEALAHTVLHHHERHQRRKKVSPYIRDDSIIIHGRVTPNPVIGLLTAVQASPETLAEQCRWHYRRNWHFSKAEIWRQYAGYAV